MRISRSRGRTSLHVQQEEEEEVIALWRRVFRSWYAQFAAICYDNLPHEYVKLLEPHLSFRWGAFIYSCIVVLAAIIFAYLFHSTSSTAYLSPSYTSNCVKVDRPVTHTYRGDLEGNWVGTRAFEPSRAVYSIALSNFSTSANQEGGATLGEEYSRLMTLVGGVLENTLGPIFRGQNLAENVLYLLLWSLPTYTGASENQQIFSFTGSPLAVISNLQYAATGLASATGACAAISSTRFDAGSQQWTVSWDAQAFTADSNCTTALPLAAVGYVAPDATISLKIDVRSYFAAVAANYPAPFDGGEGAKTLYSYQTEGLRRVAFGNGSGQGQGVLVPIGNPPRNYLLNQFYDDGYPGMSTIYCMQRADDEGNPISGSRLKCFLKINAGLFAYPLWNHFGANSGLFNPDIKPTACDCSSAALGDKSNCGNFDFLSSFVFFKADVTRPASRKESDGLYWAMSEFLDQHPNVQGNSFSQRGYLASWYTAPHLLMSLAGFNEGDTFDSDLTATYFNVRMSAQESREVFGSFCNTSHGGCSMLSLRSTNNGLYLANSWAVSPDYYQFIEGNCQFSLFNRTTWQSLIDTPPTLFEQDYYKCFPSASQAFVTASGLAISNTKALAPLLVLLVVNLLFAWQWFTGTRYPRAFSAEEKDTVLGLLAKRVLLASRKPPTLAVAAAAAAAAADKANSGSDFIPAATPMLAALMSELQLGKSEAPLEIYITSETVSSAPFQRLKACVGTRDASLPPVATGLVRAGGGTASPLTNLAANDAQLPPRRVPAKGVDRASTDSQL